MENKTIDPKTTTTEELRELTPREYFEYVKELKEQLGLLKESKDEKKEEYTLIDSFSNLDINPNAIYIHEDESNE